jgi:hypothetical protein
MEAAMKQLILLSLAMCPALWAQQQCTAGDVRGTYAVAYDSGWALMPQQGSPLPLTIPGVILGVISIGFDGTLTGGETVIIAGTAADYDVSGDVKMNPDCTGTLQILTRLKGSSDKPAPVTERFVALIGLPGAQIEIRTTILKMAGSPVGAMGNGVWKRMSPTPRSANW